MTFSRTFFAVLGIASAAFLGMQASAQRTYYIDASVARSGNGLSWGQAFKTVQEGLRVSGLNHTFWVAKGTYSGGFNIPRTYQLYGGFESGDTRLTQRRPRVNLTILDGGNTQRVVEMQDNSRLDGFDITRGRAVIPGGAGMIILGTNPIIINCRFYGNNLTTGRGSAVCVGPNRQGRFGRPRFENCEFFNNGTTTRVGHAFDIEVASPTVYHCTIRNNYGDCFHYRAGAGPDLRNIIFADSTGYGLQASDNTSKSPRLENLLFWNNASGMFNNHGSVLNKATDINKLGFARRCVAGDVKWMKGMPGVPSSTSAAVDVGQSIFLGADTDMNGNNRLLDGNLDSFMSPDIGAVESRGVRIGYTGTPTPGGNITITSNGIANTPMVLAGSLAPAAKPVPILWWGLIRIDLSASAQLQVWAPVGQNRSLAIPSNAPKGFSFVLQAVAGDGFWHHCSNMLDVRIR